MSVLAIITTMKRRAGTGGSVGGSPGRGEQRMLSAHQLPQLHRDVAELVTQQAAEAHEGGGITHDLFGLGYHLVPMGWRPGGPTTPGTYGRDGVEGPGAPPLAMWGTRGPQITGQARQQLPKAHGLESERVRHPEKGVQRGHGKQGLTRNFQNLKVNRPSEKCGFSGAVTGNKVCCFCNPSWRDGSRRSQLHEPPVVKPQARSTWGAPYWRHGTRPAVRIGAG